MLIIFFAFSHGVCLVAHKSLRLNYLPHVPIYNYRPTVLHILTQLPTTIRLPELH